ncbi:MAG: UPF0182 family protein [Peptococcaceae bacterium]
MNFKKLRIILLTPLIIILLLSLPKLLGLYTDYLWFKEVGYQGIFITTLLAKIIIGVVSFIVVFLLAFLTLHLTLRLKPPVNVHENVINLNNKKGAKNFLIILPSALLGLFAGLLTATALWENILLFLNKVPFAVQDPVFNRDLSFYFFDLSLFENIFSVAMIILFVIAILNFLFTFYLQGLGNTPLKTVINRLGYFAIAFFLLLIVGYQLKLANLLYSPRGASFGASYTDLKVTLPYYYIASAVCLISAVTIFIGMRKNNVKTAALGPALLIITIVIGGVSQNLVQSFMVTPNEINKEEEYIAENIAMTTQAFGLDKITEIEYEGDAALTFNDLEDSSATIDNIRINDFRPAMTIFNQLQSLRPYYNFSEVDVDRYKINGQVTQVFLSAREFDQNSPQAQTWINRYLKYTHGYGAVVTPVNKITPQGQPQLIVKNIPPVTEVPELTITRPEIYFGLLTKDYVLVNTTEQEFDYPVGSDNAETTYEGTAGIPLNGINRLLFALNKGSTKILVSSALTGESRIILQRDIQERVRKIAPFLKYDQDPYLVINDGKLFWMIDAYTISNKYPYSEPVIDPRFNEINYIRNSVKVIIDAYNGSVNFYLIDEADPIVRAYARIFPNLFKSWEQMPAGFKEHIRYPLDLFNIQTTVYRNYHMKNPRVFYNREDAWDIAKEQYQDNIQNVNPYYINMRLPQSPSLEFLLMRPFTPAKKDNMIAWLAARNDGDKYGQLVLFKFPKQKLIYGPMQIESRINQDSIISKELTLWGQQGSSVLRGNLLVIPIQNSLLYVEPLYIQANNANSLPEVKRIIIAYKDTIVMEETLEEALYQIFTQREAEIPDAEEEPSEINIKILSRQAREAFDKARNAAQSGNWAEYGNALNELEQIINQLEAQANTEGLFEQ